MLNHPHLVLHQQRLVRNAHAVVLLEVRGIAGVGGEGHDWVRGRKAHRGSGYAARRRAGWRRLEGRAPATQPTPASHATTGAHLLYQGAWNDTISHGSTVRLVWAGRARGREGGWEGASRHLRFRARCDPITSCGSRGRPATAFDGRAAMPYPGSLGRSSELRLLSPLPAGG